MTDSAQIAAVDAAITSRRSVRAFTQQPVARPVIEALLQVASRAPSGTNTQPWQVYVVTGASQARIIEAVCAAHDAVRNEPSLAEQYQEAYAYYPQQWKSPYIDRRRENGWGLYGLLGIGKGDKAAMHAQHQQNFRFFGAPVGLFFTVDTSMGTGSKMDIAMMMQNLMIAARARGLDTCPQAAWNHYHRLILPLLGAGEDEMLVCGMALGYADARAKVNEFITPREPVTSFTRWLD